MKLTRPLFLTIYLSMLFAMTALGQVAASNQPYKAIEVEKFTVRPGVEFPDKDLDELVRATVNNFKASKRFDSVTMAGESANAAQPTLKVSGEVTKYVKGNRAARYMVGLGAGKTKIMVDVKLTDTATGEIVFSQVVDGDVTWGFFGGDSDGAKGGVADEIIREMKKLGLAGDKKKS